MSEKKVWAEAKSLEVLAAALLQDQGLRPEDAAFCAQCLVQTNLWGVDSHGLLRLGIYLERLNNGAVKPKPKISIMRRVGVLEVLDGDDGLGYLVGRAAMQRAIALAHEHAVGVAAATNSNHFGAAALYTRMAAEAGMIGVAASNVQPNMVVPGGSRPVVGNNPLSIAVPTFGAFPFVLDMAMSQVAAGKLLLAAKKGDKIPLDWAADSQGRPTDDPQKGFEGILLPMGWYKGFALALAIEVLCGILCQGPILSDIKGMYRSPAEPGRVGHFMMAINPLAIMAKGTFIKEMQRLVETVRSSPLWDQSKEMLLPGELEHRCQQERLARGIPLPDTLYDDLLAIVEKRGLPAEIKTLPG